MTSLQSDPRAWISTPTRVAHGPGEVTNVTRWLHGSPATCPRLVLQVGSQQAAQGMFGCAVRGQIDAPGDPGKNVDLLTRVQIDLEGRSSCPVFPGNYQVSTRWHVDSDGATGVQPCNESAINIDS